jgi:hypothetical protein
MMHRSGASDKRRLILERLPAGEHARVKHDSAGLNIAMLREENVARVFLISSEVVDAEGYLSLVKEYESAGFRVRNIHVERLDDGALPGIKKIIDEISGAFRSESCLILSYGRSLAPLLVACYYVYAGTSPSLAISRVKKLDAGFLTAADEVAFAYRFKRYLGTVLGISEDDYIFQPLPLIEEREMPAPEYVTMESPDDTWTDGYSDSHEGAGSKHGHFPTPVTADEVTFEKPAETSVAHDVAAHEKPAEDEDVPSLEDLASDDYVFIRSLT